MSYKNKRSKSVKDINKKRNASKLVDNEEDEIVVVRQSEEEAKAEK